MGRGSNFLVFVFLLKYEYRRTHLNPPPTCNMCVCTTHAHLQCAHSQHAQSKMFGSICSWSTYSSQLIHRLWPHSLPRRAYPHCQFMVTTVLECPGMSWNFFCVLESPGMSWIFYFFLPMSWKCPGILCYH